jgi:LDH2 family malate/lactate/ureidoglycolate dehydrogenase
VAVYRSLPDFKQELEALIGYLKGAKSAPGETVLAPGEKEAQIEAERGAAGIPLPAATVDGLQWELDHFKIPRKLLTLGKESQGHAWNFAHHA